MAETPTNLDLVAEEEVQYLHTLLDTREIQYAERKDIVVQRLAELASAGALDLVALGLEYHSTESTDGVAHWADLTVIFDAFQLDQDRN